MDSSLSCPKTPKPQMCKNKDKNNKCLTKKAPLQTRRNLNTLSCLVAHSLNSERQFQLLKKWLLKHLHRCLEQSWDFKAWAKLFNLWLQRKIHSLLHQLRKLKNRKQLIHQRKQPTVISHHHFHLRLSSHRTCQVLSLQKQKIRQNKTLQIIWMPLSKMQTTCSSRWTPKPTWKKALTRTTACSQASWWASHSHNLLFHPSRKIQKNHR